MAYSCLSLCVCVFVCVCVCVCVCVYVCVCVCNGPWSGWRRHQTWHSAKFWARSCWRTAIPARQLPAKPESRFSICTFVTRMRPRTLQRSCFKMALCCQWHLTTTLPGHPELVIRMTIMAINGYGILFTGQPSMGIFTATSPSGHLTVQGHCCMSLASSPL